MRCDECKFWNNEREMPTDWVGFQGILFTRDSHGCTSFRPAENKINRAENLEVDIEMTQKPINRTTPKPRIAACPNCKTDAFIAVYTYDSGWRHVECDKCYYLGPGEGSVLSAIRAHNTKTNRAENAET
jgi:Zn ribbon nucleic-acid-binding protein